MRTLMYHQIVDGEPNEIHAVSAQQFAAQMHWLREAGFQVVSLEDWWQMREIAAVPRNAVALTFDDGYQDNYTVAWPLLQELDLPATIFLVTGSVGGTSGWHQGVLSRTPMLSWAQIREMARSGIAFGAHTVTHAPLTSLDIGAARWEISESRDQLQQALGLPVLSMAYPFSQYDSQVKSLVAECGFRLACTYRPGYVGTAGGDVMALERIGILATDTLVAFKDKVRGAMRLRAAWIRRLFRARARALLQAIRPQP
jgi:peptidoglycan/xylan/chitin deacetylase (PgdA/CDA1 family)